MTSTATLVATATRLGVPLLGYASVAVLISVATAAVWRVRPPAGVISAIGIMLGLLAGPLTWTGYTLFALPVLLSRRWHGWEWFAAISLSCIGWLATLTEQVPYLDLLPSAEVAGSALVILFALVVRDAFAPAGTERVLTRGPKVPAERSVATNAA